MTTSPISTVREIPAQGSRQASPRQRPTVDDLHRMPEDDILRELVDGELREWMAPGPAHWPVRAPETVFGWPSSVGAKVKGTFPMTSVP